MQETPVICKLDITCKLPTGKLPTDKPQIDISKLSKLELAKGILEKTITVPRDEYFGALKIGFIEPRLLFNECVQVSGSDLTLKTATLENAIQSETKDVNISKVKVIKRVAIIPTALLFSSVFRNVATNCHICGETDSVHEMLTIIYCPERNVFGPGIYTIDPRNKDCINFEVEDVRFCKQCRSIYEIDQPFYNFAHNIEQFASIIHTIVINMARIDHHILKTSSVHLLSGYRNDCRKYRYQKVIMTQMGMIWGEINITFSYVVVDSDRRSLRKILVFHSQEETVKYMDSPIYIDWPKMTEQVIKTGPKPLIENWEGFLKKAHLASYFWRTD